MPESERESDGRVGGVADDWLMKIYDARLQRFLHDNDRIWSSGSLLVPLSLAPFLALASIESPELAHLIVLGTASTMLVAFWLLIAESHRSYQERSLEWIEEIEGKVGVRPRDEAPSRRFPARQARRGFVVAVPLLWVIAAVVWPR